VPQGAVADRIRDGDYRWVNRGGVDLLDANPNAQTSAFGLPRAKTLYGPLPEQMQDPASFAARLKQLLAARRRHGIAEGELAAVPEPKDRGVCLLVLKLPGRDAWAVTALNFGRAEMTEELDLAAVPGLDAAAVRGRAVKDAVTGRPAGAVSDAGRLTIRLGPRTYQALVPVTVPPA